MYSADIRSSSRVVIIPVSEDGLRAWPTFSEGEVLNVAGRLENVGIFLTRSTSVVFRLGDHGQTGSLRFLQEPEPSSSHS